jgi:ribosomal protein S18 acetylase RimI-like enzyme
MLTFTRINTRHPQYVFVEKLLHQSFPLEERRNDAEQRNNTDHNASFFCYLIEENKNETEENQLIGFITLWKLNGFYYAEHLATSPEVRNKGYGKHIMEELKQQFADNPIVLEVERPENEMSKRRIGFYQRCGFSLCLQDYIQPAYRKGGKEVPLYLMYTGREEIDTCFSQIRDEIYRHVYGVNKL